MNEDAGFYIQMNKEAGLLHTEKEGCRVIIYRWTRMQGYTQMNKEAGFYDRQLYLIQVGAISLGVHSLDYKYLGGKSHGEHFLYTYSKCTCTREGLCQFFIRLKLIHASVNDPHSFGLSRLVTLNVFGVSSVFASVNWLIDIISFTSPIHCQWCWEKATWKSSQNIYTSICMHNQNTYTRYRELLTAMTEERMWGKVAGIFH